jgi:hypothetical protein
LSLSAIALSSPDSGSRATNSPSSTRTVPPLSILSRRPDELISNLESLPNRNAKSCVAPVVVGQLRAL